MAEGGEDSGDHDAHDDDSDDDNNIEIGEECDLTDRLEDAGTFEIGCREPGHYDVGVKITVNVT